MAFRDDRGAMRARVEELEDELAQAKHELQTQKEPPLAKVGRSSALAWIPIVLSVGGLLAAAVLGAGGQQVLALVLTIAAVTLLWLGVMVLVVGRLLIVVAPNQVAVLSGRRYMAADGTVRGYRTIRGGRALRIPLLETVDYMDVSVMKLEVELRSAYLRGGGVADVGATATVRIAREMPHLANAVERFLGQPREEIATVAQQTIEGTLRGVLASLTREEAEGNPRKVAEHTKAEVQEDMDKLGFVLETFELERLTSR